MDNANAGVIRHAETSTNHCLILACPDFSKPFLVATDGFSAAVGAVLSQLDEMGGNSRYVMQVEV